MNEKETYKHSVTSSRHVKTVISGANPDRFEFPFWIPQTVPEGEGVGGNETFFNEGFFSKDRPL